MDNSQSKDVEATIRFTISNAYIGAYLLTDEERMKAISDAILDLDSPTAWAFRAYFADSHS